MLSRMFGNYSKPDTVFTQNNPSIVINSLTKIINYDESSNFHFHFHIVYNHKKPFIRSLFYKDRLK